MNNLFQEASEAGENPDEGEKSKQWRKTSLIDEGLTTPGTAFTSPWIGTNKSPDKYFVNTVIHPALPGVNTTRYLDSTVISALSQAMSPEEKLGSWFASTPAGLGQSSTARPNTRHTDPTSLAGDQSQLSHQNSGNTIMDPTATVSRTQDLFLDSLVEGQSHLPTEQVNSCSGTPRLPNADQNKPSTSGLGTRDSFFDRVPKGPRISHWNAQAPAFNPWKSTQDQARASRWDNLGISDSPAEEVQENPRPRLTLRIPNTSRGSDKPLSALQLATHSEIPARDDDAPHTTDYLAPSTKASIPGLQGPEPETSRGIDILNPAARPFHSKFSGTRAPARRAIHTVMQPAAATHTNSRTWTSNLVVEKERWQRVEDSLGKMNLLRSSVVPKTLKDWLAHQRGRADAKKEREQRRLNDMNPSQRDLHLPSQGRPAKIGPAFRGRVFEHKNYSSVLVQQSVWARMYEAPAKRLDPLWPCAEEMKEEGDERNTSGYRRFPALPRVPGNDTVQYKLRAIQPFLPFDTVWELPTKKSVEAANEKYSSKDTETMEGYLGKSLLDALDCVTYDSC